MIAALLQAKADLFKTLADPVRIHLLEMLAERDHEVGELIAAFSTVDATTVNGHLHELRHERLVDVQRTGHEVIYSLHAPRVASLFAEARHVLRERGRDQ